jgi:hypothetical protein
MGEGGGVYRVLVGRPVGRKPLERPRCRWEDKGFALGRQSLVGQTGFGWLRIGFGGRLF